MSDVFASTIISEIESSALKGDSNAQLKLGQCYLTGANGFTQNPDSAFKYLYQASMNNNHEAYNLIGICYMEGIGTVCDYAKGLKWLEKGVHFGDPEAKAMLGMYIMTGKGTTPDQQRGVALIIEASQEGSTTAQRLLQSQNL
ncbi:MAG: sel1 repeat family protein [Muribaculum sp.]|nr:sel1 repeat family protein [Muribaculum sp.]